MKRVFAWSVLACLLTGCIGQPFANICDSIRPGRMGPNEVAPYGGVWVQQHTITPLAGPLPGDVDGIPPPPNVIPPPAPLPGSRPPASFDLQAPMPTNIPPPPPYQK